MYIIKYFLQYTQPSVGCKCHYIYYKETSVGLSTTQIECSIVNFYFFLLTEKYLSGFPKLRPVSMCRGNMPILN